MRGAQRQCVRNLYVSRVGLGPFNSMVSHNALRTSEEKRLSILKNYISTTGSNRRKNSLFHSAGAQHILSNHVIKVAWGLIYLPGTLLLIGSNQQQCNRPGSKLTGSGSEPPKKIRIPPPQKKISDFCLRPCRSSDLAPTLLPILPYF